MKYTITIDVYHDDFEPICFEGLTNTEGIYNACKQAVSYCQSQLDHPVIAEIFIELNGNIKPIYVGEVRIGVAQAISVYRMYTGIINKLGEVL